jgi:hypothetical protein
MKSENLQMVLKLLRKHLLVISKNDFEENNFPLQDLQTKVHRKSTTTSIYYIIIVIIIIDTCTFNFRSVLINDFYQVSGYRYFKPVLLYYFFPATFLCFACLVFCFCVFVLLVLYLCAYTGFIIGTFAVKTAR